MSLVSVSDCFTKHLRTLNLNQFPCIDGRKVEEIDPQVDELLDLIRDQKSPWHRKFEWSSNCESIREIYIKNRRSLKTSAIEKYFTNLRFNDQEIGLVDSGLKKFVNLTDLILTCNRLRQIDFNNLPSTLKVLDVSGNFLSEFQAPSLNTPRSPKLEHLGLALNWLRHFSAADSSFSSTLVSLDLSHNQIRDLVALRNELVKLKLLKNLVLYGNPIVLLPGYRGCFIDSMPKLFSLDDKPITRNERIDYLDFNLLADEINKQSEILVSFNQLKNLIVRELPDFEDSLEIFVYKYVLRFYSIDDEFVREEVEENENRMLYSMITYKTNTKRSNSYRAKVEETEELEPAVNIDLNEKGLMKLRFKSIDQLRDFFLDGTRIELIERKIDYQSKDYNKDEATTTAASSDKQGKKKKESSSKESEAPGKNNKKKKKKMTLLDNFNKTNVEDKVVASFDIELSDLLDGHVKEMSRKFSAKLPPIETTLEIKPPPSTAGGGKKKKDTSKKVTTANSKDTKKKQVIESPPELVEPPPLELDFRLQVLDFASFKDAKRYFDEANNKQLLKQ